jgi:ADP-heptose:LPS heptosyltransferase
MRILTLVPGGISDQLLFFPTLETLQRTYPNATIDVLIEPRAKAAYRVYPNVNEVLLFDYRDQYGLADYLNLLGVIRDREYEIAIDLSERWAIGLLLWLNGIPVRVGYEKDGAWFLSHRIQRPTDGYLADTYHALLGGLEITSPTPPLQLTLKTEDIDWAEREQKRLDVKDSGYILLYGGLSDLNSSRDLETVYPIDSWVQILEEIQGKQPSLPLVAIEGDSEESWVAALTEKVSDLKVSRTTDLGKMAAMIAGGNILLSTDSVPLQLAVAVGTPTIALLAPSPAKLLPSEGDFYASIYSPTAKTADILPETVLARLWQS